VLWQIECQLETTALLAPLRRSGRPGH
jgi:hypothetical protein